MAQCKTAVSNPIANALEVLQFLHWAMPSTPCIFTAIMCPTGLDYKTCGPSCPRTCHNLATDLDYCEHQPCVEGCFCPQGLVLHSKWQCYKSWWRHQMETFSALLAICAGNSPFPGEFLAQRPVTRSFGVFFDLRLDKRWSKQSWGWWFETLSRPLWCHCNLKTICHVQDLWKLAWPYKQLRLPCPPNPWTLPGTDLHSGFQSSWWAFNPLC